MSAVLYEKHGAIGVVSLNRPERLNAYDVAMRDGLFENLSAVRDDPEVRVALLRGEGRAFCSGGDLQEFGTAPSPTVARAVRWQRDVAGLLYGLPKPTIAAVHGAVVGSGFEMALLCDLCIAADDARFALPEISRGMIPGFAGTQTLPRAVGSARALDLILSGRTIDAAETHALGIVAAIVPAEALMPTALSWGQRLLAIDADLLSTLKRVVQEGLDLPLARALVLERSASSCLDFS